MRNRIASIMAVAAVPLLFMGCYPEQPEYINEYDLVYTNHSPDMDFGALNTYALPDSVVIISGDLDEGETPEMVDPFYGDKIVARIRQNMNALGWVEVTDSAQADVIILPSAMKTLNIDTYYYYWGYWGWYYPGYYPGWGWYYPGYVPTYTSYTTGSLIMQMTVRGDLSPAGNVSVPWVAVINGLLEGSDASIADRVTTNIDQAFKQSEYLKQ